VTRPSSGQGASLAVPDSETMIPANRIRRYVNEIVREFHPERVILFGSHADGTPRKDSDVDLLIVMPHTVPAVEQAARIRRKLPAGFPLDLIVRSPRMVRKRLQMGDDFLRGILEHGKVLHEAGRP
jgi:uncharacterized protein